VTQVCDHGRWPGVERVIINGVGNVSAGRQARLLSADPAGTAEAAAILRAGGLVAFPTETVYGLGAHALDVRAVHAIFEAKGRPADDPLIVHLLSAADLTSLARPTPEAQRLAAAFWPGPLTLVLPKLPHVPAEVTAGLDTVAVRVPAHPVARGLLEASELPLAAPSANLFGRPSPTRAAHVLHDLGGRIDAILDGGPTTVGVESTIVDLSGEQPRLLRPGGLAVEAIEALLGVKLLDPPPRASGPQPAPGLLASHYAPRTPLTLVAGNHARDRLWAEVTATVASGQRVGVLLLDEDRHLLPPAAMSELVGAYAEPERSAARLFDALRALDAQNLDVLFARDLADPTSGLGRALADRLRRAAARRIDS
jgi:L-threonylcarbamoyladenylate synthase